MEPYQRASQAIRSGEELPLQILKGVGLSALGGAGASAGAKLAGKLIPAVGAMINKYVPENISQAGLNKIDSRFGKFISGALSQGYTYEDVRSFLGEKVEKTQSQASSEGKNIVEKISPELHQFLTNQIKSGRNPMQAGAIASKEKKFSNAIKQLTEEHKVPWSEILQQVYGAIFKPEKQGVAAEELARVQNAYPQTGQLTPEQQAEVMNPPGSMPDPTKMMGQGQPQQPQGQGGIDPQLAQLLQQGNALLQKFRGNQ